VRHAPTRGAGRAGGKGWGSALEADGTFRSTMAYRIERDGSIQALEREFTGTWVREGPGYRLDWNGAGQTPATLEGDTFTYYNVGMLLAFRRQI
jgi:hypothetical protein